MEMYYFSLGILSIISLIFCSLIVWGLVKVIKTKNDLENLTKQSALSELAEIKMLFTKMTISSNELADFLKNRQIEFCLGFDYGMGAIGICKETNGHFTWETDLKN